MCEDPTLVVDYVSEVGFLELFDQLIEHQEATNNGKSLLQHSGNLFRPSINIGECENGHEVVV